MKVLKLSAQGLPQSWITLEQAVIHYAAGEVRWESGGQIARFRGGYSAITGEQSVIAVNSIIGTRGVPGINPFDLKPSLTNSKLFTRDRNVCAYCGVDHHETELTREHIIPFAQDGQDHWMNVVTACRLSPPNHSLPSRVGGCIPMRRRVLRHFWTGKDYEYGLRVRIYGRTAVGRVRGQS